MRLPVLAALALLLAPLPAIAQTWTNFDYPEHGFSVHFPDKPRVSAGTFKHSLGEPVPAVIYSVRQDGVVYTMTVADFSKSPPDQQAMIDDTVKAWNLVGQVKVDVVARINREFGRELSVSLGDGSRSLVAIFFFNNKLYELDGRALPPDVDRGAARTIRFQQSLTFRNE
jgi:hypothetical protein